MHRLVVLVPLLLLVTGGCASRDDGPAVAPSAATFQATPVALRSGEPIAGSHSDPYEQGKAHLRHGRYGLALEEFRRALMQEGREVHILNATAIVYDELGRFDLSGRYYRAALALEPGSAATLNNLGRSLLRQGRIERALAVLERARSASAGNATVEQNVALARRALARTRSVEHGGSLYADGGASPRIARTSLDEQVLRTRPAEAASRPAAFRHDASQAIDAPKRARVEVANGTGRTRMAARMGHYLREHGLEVNRLFNADHYGYRTSRILFRPGFGDEARRLRALLPIEVAMEESDAPLRDVRLQLGSDLLAFDAALLVGAPH